MRPLVAAPAPAGEPPASPPELVRFVEALARFAADRDYDAEQRRRSQPGDDTSGHLRPV